MSNGATPAAQEALAIVSDGLGKAYQLGEQLSLGHSVQTVLRLRPEVEGFWALKDVTFNVQRGDYFGIVGSNGSGKSTLTQILAGITVPTAGRAEIFGSVLPLLEVGSGFHLELTGRENIVLLGTILGLGRTQIENAMKQIVDFAGVELHLDTPVKRYSSGMQARLAFSTAICFPADIYIFDEVLAVVDDSFRDQCMEELSRINRLGATIIFMSHDLDLVASICNNGMWLEKGTVRLTGSMGAVAEAYAAHTRELGVAHGG
jgi:ABC-type polysaccharide/polyol phosphate transport system ATPase subunit